MNLDVFIARAVIGRKMLKAAQPSDVVLYIPTFVFYQRNMFYSEKNKRIRNFYIVSSNLNYISAKCSKTNYGSSSTSWPTYFTKREIDFSNNILFSSLTNQIKHAVK